MELFPSSTEPAVGVPPTVNGTAAGAAAVNATGAAAINGTDAATGNVTDAAAVNGTAIGENATSVASGLNATAINATGGNATAGNVTSVTAADASQTVTYHAADASAGLTNIVTQLNATNQLQSGANIGKFFELSQFPS